MVKKKEDRMTTLRFVKFAEPKLKATRNRYEEKLKKDIKESKTNSPKRRRKK